MAKTNEPKYTVEQIITSKKYAEDVDIVIALLTEKNEYKLSEVDDLIKEWKGKVID